MSMTPIIHRVEAELPPVGMKMVLLASSVHANIDVEAVEVPPRESKEFVSGLEWKLTDGSLIPIRKGDLWSYHSSLVAVIKLENELSDAVRDVMEYKSIASYLADCQAATASSVGNRKSSSNVEKKRQAAICRTAIGMIEAGYLVGCKNINQRYTSKEGIKRVLDRCRESADLCEGKKA